MKESNLTTVLDLQAEIRMVKRYIDPEIKNWSAFNPSIGMSPEGECAMLLRSSNYEYSKKHKPVITEGSGIKNLMYFCKLDSDLNISKISLINFFGLKVPILRGVEDGKLFWRDGAWHLTGVIKEVEGIPIPRMATFKLDGTNAYLAELHDYPWCSSFAEKNWMTTYETNSNFDFVYDGSSVVVNKELIQVLPNGPNVRGNTNLWDLGDDTYLGLVHTTQYSKINYFDPLSFGVVQSTLRNYFHMFSRYNKYGKLIQISEPFKFTNASIEFAAGLIIKDNHVIVSFGRNDVSAYLAKLKVSTVMKMLKDLE